MLFSCGIMYIFLRFLRGGNTPFCPAFAYGKDILDTYIATLGFHAPGHQLQNRAFLQMEGFDDIVDMLHLPERKRSGGDQAVEGSDKSSVFHRGSRGSGRLFHGKILYFKRCIRKDAHQSTALPVNKSRKHLTIGHEQGCSQIGLSHGGKMTLHKAI